MTIKMSIANQLSPTAIKPELILDEGAIVALKAKIDCLVPSDAPIIPKVKLEIKYGTIFHPGARLFLLIPPDMTKSLKEQISNDMETPEITCIIGKHNLFHETCTVFIDLGASSSSSSYEIIGEYNEFEPKCRIQTGSIGSGNIFGSSSNVTCNTQNAILDGFVVAPRVQWTFHPSPDTTTSTTTTTIELKDMVLFSLDHQVKTRTYVNGKERNKKTLEGRLPAMRHVLRRFHKLHEVAK